MARLQSFALNADPLIKELIPVAQQPRADAARGPGALARPAAAVRQPRPADHVSKTGLPALRDVLNGARPLLGALGPFLEQLNPILTGSRCTSS